MDIIEKLSQEFKISKGIAGNITSLLDNDNTVPFIARYRKEATNSMNDEDLRNFDERYTYLKNLGDKVDEVLRKIEEQGKLTEEIKTSLLKAETLQEVDDLYKPYRQKRKTRASVARERGLEPLADAIYLDEIKGSVLKFAEDFIDPEKDVLDAGAAISGACDIIAENISDTADFLKKIRALTYANGVLHAKAQKDEDSVYSMYYGYTEAVSKIARHRVLALNRGEKEGFLNVSLEVEEGLILHTLESVTVEQENEECAALVKAAAADSYKRLIAPSIEREIRNLLTDSAAEGAIKVFAVNLKSVLLSPPLKDRVILGLDPGYRTGVKFAVIDETGKDLEVGVIYPTPPKEDLIGAGKKVKELILKYQIGAIAIGNGTASKETESFVRDLLEEISSDAFYFIVNEAGASVYSASKLAQKEFPDYDVSLRSAVSIARRLQDPLAELVKIEPKAVGVGQYQHDMPQTRLAEALSNVVEDCVNRVGVDLNTASSELLSYVSGINQAIAKSIVAYREKKKRIKSRDELLEVPRLGVKAFEQCAGFLRIPEAENILDNTGVHPESYAAANIILKKLGYSEKDVRENNLSDVRHRSELYGEKKLAMEANVGEYTFKDILEELAKPGRDVRGEFEKPVFLKDVKELSDLKEGMILTGTVRNVTDFGAFIDIGVHRDGLCHVSELTTKFIKHPSEVVSAGMRVKVKVLSADSEKNRLSLSMKGLNS